MAKKRKAEERKRDSVGRKFLTRAIWLVSLVSLFTDIASEMLYPVMPVYLKSIGFSVLLIGILEGFAEATAGVSKGYFGHYSDRLGRRVPFIQAGYGLSAISKPMMALFTWPLWVFFARTLDRLGKGIRTSARDAILSDESLPENKGKVFGFHRSMDTIGAAIGPLFALLFLWLYPGQYRWLFFIAFIPGLFAVLITILLKEKSSKRKPLNGSNHSVPKAPGFFSYLRYWRRAGSSYKFLVSGLLLFTLFNSSDAFLLLAVREQGLSDTAMIGVYIFYNMVYALFSYPVGVLADRIGLRTMLVIGFVIFAIVYLLIGFATSVVVFGALFMGYGLYAACTEGISKALISNLARQGETATAIGFYNSLASIMTLIASTVAGLLWYTVGAKWMFIISGAGVLGVAIYLVVYFLAERSEQ